MSSFPVYLIPAHVNVSKYRKEFTKFRTMHYHILFSHHVVFYTSVPKKNYTEAKQEEDTMSQQHNVWGLGPYSGLNPGKILLTLIKDCWSKTHP